MTTRIDRRTALQTLARTAASGMLAACGARHGAPARDTTRETTMTSTHGSNLHARIHDAIAGHIARGELPGAIGLVSRPGEVEVAVVGAMADGGPPLQRDAIFRIASMTKPITAAAALIAIDDGKLALDEPVDRLLPELAHPRVLRRFDGPLDDTVPAARPIQVRDLLSFTMGLGILLAPPGTFPIQRALDEHRLGQGFPRPQVPPDPDEWIRRLGTLPLCHQPGEQWMYHTGCDVLGVLLARAYRQPFESVLEERLFAPLGMVDTGFSVPPARRDRLVTSYAADPATGARTLNDAPDGDWSRPPAFPSGGGGLVSTIDDYLAFAELLAGGGERRGKRILSARAVTAMTTDQLSPQQKAASRWLPGYFDDHTWGYGVQVITGRDDSGPTGAYGWDGGLGTVWRNDPAGRRVTILLTQQAFTSPVPPPVCRDFWLAARAGT
ncbi:MAG TPA: serine hydrolase domain-containing protein [Kofleriaceae bacterium]|nr:serine hydrolase domain-containing protein [Kofleriaceae bacterium]